MKKGQLMSQPFIYIFAIIVIGLILIFGFTYVAKVMKTGCAVEVLDFRGDVQKKVNELVALSYGSSFECEVVRVSGQSDFDCEIVLPNNIAGVCFVGRGVVYSPSDIPFDDVRTIADALRTSNQNLYFAEKQGSSCEVEPMVIKKLTSEGAVCIDMGTNERTFIMESVGNKVKIMKS